MPAENDTPITSVLSAYGHTFLSDGDYESCLTCGATYALIATPDEPSDGAYVTASGHDPAECTHDTSATCHADRYKPQ